MTSTVPSPLGVVQAKLKLEFLCEELQAKLFHRTGVPLRAALTLLSRAEFSQRVVSQLQAQRFNSRQEEVSVKTKNHEVPGPFRRTRYPLLGGVHPWMDSQPDASIWEKRHTSWTCTLFQLHALPRQHTLDLAPSERVQHNHSTSEDWVAEMNVGARQCRCEFVSSCELLHNQILGFIV